MDRWEQIHRWVEGVDQADQTAAQISSGHLRTCERGWKEYEEEQTDELCDDVAEGEAVAELFAVSGDQKIVQPPLYEGHRTERRVQETAAPYQAVFPAKRMSGNAAAVRFPCRRRSLQAVQVQVV